MAITIKSTTERALSYRRTPPRKTEERLPENLFRHFPPLHPMQKGKIPPLGCYDRSEAIKKFSFERLFATQDKIRTLLSESSLPGNFIATFFGAAMLSPSAPLLVSTVSSAPLLVSAVSKTSICASIFDIIQSIPKEDREEVIQRALAAVTDKTPSDRIPHILQAAILSPSAPLLISKVSNFFSRHDIFNIIQSIPKEDREEVIQRALAAVTDKTPSDRIPHILQAAILSPSAPLLISTVSDITIRYRMIDLIQSIPKEDREEAIQRTLAV